MSSKPMVTAIVIFLNAGETFFREAIESIFAQTYDNWELLLVDDGSTDISTEIARQYASRYPAKVRYLEHEGHQNRGMSAARNLGIQHASGEYIAFLDADDLWLPQKLVEQVAILAAHPEAAMLYGRTQCWYSWMENNPTIWKLDTENRDVDFLTISSNTFDRLVSPPTQLILFLENKEIYPCTCSILIRRRVFEDENIGGFEEDFRDAHEDMVFHSKVFLNAPVYVASECWDKYRIHPDSYWRKADREGRGTEVRRVGHLKYLKWLEHYLRDRNIKNIQIWLALKKAQLFYKQPILYYLIVAIERPNTQNLLTLFRQLVYGIVPYNLRLWLKERKLIGALILPKLKEYSAN
jgi:glycosyltransferase involved in cell wall biosynthesis